MNGLLQLLNLLLSLGSLACLIMVVIKLFKEKGVAHGILGVICGLYTFIWGWMNATRLGIRNLMMIWTAIFVLNLVVGISIGAFTASFGP
ncbi:MAG: hypothetical protein KGS46_20410 [Chloroflexi bacterium]|nr:hypothetical protein [Chloroflexota bacterium]